MKRHKILARPSLVAGVLLVLGFAVIAVAAPVIAPPHGDSPYLIPRDGFSPQPMPPTPRHLLGTMEGQTDVFYGLIWGTRMAFRVGLIATLGRALIGVLLGLLAGSYGRFVDAALMRVTDAFLAFPMMAAAMVMLATFGAVLERIPITRSLSMSQQIEGIVLLTLVLFGWMPYARLLRGNVLSEREMAYVEAARSVGVKSLRVVFRHVLPNATRGLFVLMASDVGAMVVLVAAFTYIGIIGFSKGELATDWGQMLSLSRNWIIGSPSDAFQYWYTYLPVSAAIVLFSAGWHLLGDGLRDVLDPRLR